MKISENTNSPSSDIEDTPQVVINKDHIITVEVTNHVTKSSSSSSSSSEKDLPNLPKSQGSLDQDEVTIVLDPSMIPPEHDDSYPIIGGVAV